MLLYPVGCLLDQHHSPLWHFSTLINANHINTAIAMQQTPFPLAGRVGVGSSLALTSFDGLGVGALPLVHNVCSSDSRIAATVFGNLLCPTDIPVPPLYFPHLRKPHLPPPPPSFPPFSQAPTCLPRPPLSPHFRRKWGERGG
ncbi:MAG: hypothetical protein JW908_17045 [Anaerolineales bacterium]|nr:hypothetical protein [Anaerolineales bacterium]